MGYHEEVMPDRLGRFRFAIVFHLDLDSVSEVELNNLPQGKSAQTQSDTTLKKKSLQELRAALSNISKSGSTFE